VFSIDVECKRAQKSVAILDDFGHKFELYFVDEAPLAARTVIDNCRSLGWTEKMKTPRSLLALALAFAFTTQLLAPHSRSRREAITAPN
jgi:hypothetical protein